MVIIFLDIDGVLVTARSQWGLGTGGGRFKEFDPLSVGLINKLCDINPNTKIVVSSTWRRFNTLDELKELAKVNGITCEIIGKTPVIQDEKFRGTEIKSWLDTHTEKLGITNYLILDDDIDMLPEQYVHFSPIEDSGIGLDMDAYFRACVILGHEKVPGGEAQKAFLPYLPINRYHHALEALKKISIGSGPEAAIAVSALKNIRRQP